MKKIKVVFFATPDIALKSFISLIEDENFEMLALVTQPQRPKGRGNKISDSKIKQEALKRGIQVFEPAKISKDDEIIEKLKSLSPDFFVTFAFGQILNTKVLDIPKFYTINLHASLLPKYRGANPICECLLRGDKKTGITTMITVLELDAGDICKTLEIELDDNTDYLTLSNKISELSPNLIKETLTELFENKITPVKQNANEATFTKKMTKADKVIDFNLTPYEIHNKIRAYCGINTAHFIYNGKIIKVIKSSISKKDLKASIIGEVKSVDKEGVLIACKNGAILLERVKPEGKNEMSAYDWSLGSKIKTGDVILCS